MDKSSWWKIMLVSIGVNALLFWIVRNAVQRAVAEGPLEALFDY